MAMFKAYFDASGNALNQPFIVVAGYIANLFQWREFENQWTAIHKRYSVDLPFHMAEFMAALKRPEYKHQTNARADYVEIAKNPDIAKGFLGQLSILQSLMTNCGVSCIVTMDVYNEVSTLLDLRKVVPPYALAARMCIERIHQWEQQFAAVQPVECIFEAGDFEQGKFTDLMIDEGMDAPIYKNKCDFAGLQAADHYAWEQSHFLKEYGYGNASRPGPIIEMMLHTIPKLHVEPTTATLIRLCQMKGIDPKTGGNCLPRNNTNS
jgi:hypothetical protein